MTTRVVCARERPPLSCGTCCYTGFSLAVQRDPAAMSGDQSSRGSSVRWFLMYFSLERQVPRLACKAPSSGKLRNCPLALVCSKHVGPWSTRWVKGGTSLIVTLLTSHLGKKQKSGNEAGAQIRGPVSLLRGRQREHRKLYSDSGCRASLKNGACLMLLNTCCWG